MIQARELTIQLDAPPTPGIGRQTADVNENGQLMHRFQVSRSPLAALNITRQSPVKVAQLNNPVRGGN